MPHTKLQQGYSLLYKSNLNIIYFRNGEVIVYHRSASTLC